VSTHAYVNPVVAVLLGVLFANEKNVCSAIAGTDDHPGQRPADQPGKIQEGACLRQGCVRKASLEKAISRDPVPGPGEKAEGDKVLQG